VSSGGYGITGVLQAAKVTPSVAQPPKHTCRFVGQVLKKICQKHAFPALASILPNGAIHTFWKKCCQYDTKRVFAASISIKIPKFAFF
jgi:hypothetical protein